MTKKEVNVCDVCDKTISDSKCEVCGKDICGNCENIEEITIGDYLIIKTFKICSSCENNIGKIQSISNKYSDFSKEVKELILKNMKKIILLENLDDKKEVPNEKERLSKTFEDSMFMPSRRRRRTAKSILMKEYAKKKIRARRHLCSVKI